MDGKKELMEGWLDGEMDGKKEKLMEGWLDGWMERKKMDGRIGWLDGKIDGRIDDEWMERMKS